MELRVNASFKNMSGHSDSNSRSEHALDRMASRGIGKDQIKEAVQKGAKHLRQDGSIVAEYRWFKVIYREYPVENIRKIYPITVIEV